ncbi:MAG: hypothetical protein JRH18_01410 [Deltaproteobacteria bacterium]|nr:hypothetical protein [Deltaproteobacteria bacterium]MBW1960281.1 hypothetical protein [Deltaproteobacteria bacterium]MBW2150305.1 hypothetical protein [Deltaproteobacteria bacterium]
MLKSIPLISYRITPERGNGYDGSQHGTLEDTGGALWFEIVDVDPVVA